MKFDMLAAIAVTILASGDAAAQVQQTAMVEARTATGGVAVTWRFARPITEVTFREADIIRDRWTIVTPSVTMDKGVVRSKRP
jgi:hypothetical protein